MIDPTYGHPVAGADGYERELLDAFDARREAFGRVVDTGDEEDAAGRTSPEREKPRVCRASDAYGSDGARTRDLRRDRPAL